MRGVALLMTIALLLLAREWRLLPTGTLVVHFLDVGQGDSALVVTPSGKQIVIDGGPDLRTLEELGTVMPFLDRSIDLMILSHPNTDHLTALPELLRRYDVRRVLITGIDYPIGLYEDMLHEIAVQGIEIVREDPRRGIDMGDGVTLDVLWPGAGLFGKPIASEDTNDTSIVLKVLYHGHGVLFTGDIDTKAEDAMVAAGIDLHTDVLKVPHHGSRFASSIPFLTAVHPSLGVISVGKGNSYGHPTPDALKRYRERGIPIRTTMDEGMITVAFP